MSKTPTGGANQDDIPDLSEPYEVIDYSNCNEVVGVSDNSVDIMSLDDASGDRRTIMLFGATVHKANVWPNKASVESVPVLMLHGMDISPHINSRDLIHNAKRLTTISFYTVKLKNMYCPAHLHFRVHGNVDLDKIRDRILEWNPLLTVVPQHVDHQISIWIEAPTKALATHASYELPKVVPELKLQARYTDSVASRVQRHLDLLGIRWCTPITLEFIEETNELVIDTTKIRKQLASNDSQEQKESTQIYHSFQDVVSCTRECISIALVTFSCADGAQTRRNKLKAGRHPLLVATCVVNTPITRRTLNYHKRTYTLTEEQSAHPLLWLKKECRFVRNAHIIACEEDEPDVITDSHRKDVQDTEDSVAYRCDNGVKDSHRNYVFMNKQYLLDR